MRRTKNTAMVLCSLLGSIGLFQASAQASVMHTLSGLSSVGTPVSFQAELSIVANTLTVKLSNLSSATSIAPNDVLSSYYFDIVNNASVRPTLTYVSAVGNVWLTNKNAADTLQTAGANLKALNSGDNTWQFKATNPALAPFMGFGLGTVGNGNLFPSNAFNGNITGGMDYSIYAGDVTTSNLHNRLLVKGPITFTFTGVSGFTESDISANAAFGMGTAPDSFLTNVPEPASLSLLSLGAMGLLRRRSQR